MTKVSTFLMALSTTAVIEVIREGKFMNAYQNGENVTKLVPQPIRRMALYKGANLMFENGEFHMVKVGTKPKAKVAKAAPVLEPTMDLVVTDIADPLEFIKESPSIKPADLIINDLKWKYLVRTALRGKNIMMTGPAGSGKTLAGKYLGQVLKRQLPTIELLEILAQVYLPSMDCIFLISREEAAKHALSVPR